MALLEKLKIKKRSESEFLALVREFFDLFKKEDYDGATKKYVDVAIKFCQFPSEKRDELAPKIAAINKYLGVGIKEEEVIKEFFSRKLSEELIKKILEEIGWTKEEIEEYIGKAKPEKVAEVKEEGHKEEEKAVEVKKEEYKEKSIAELLES